MEQFKKDDRFSHIAKDPRFHQLPSRERKVKIDKRFKSMFEDKKFKLKYTVDKRGRPINTSTNENLRKFYELSDSGSDSDSQSDDDDDDESEEEKIEENIVEEKKKAKKGREMKTKDKKKETDLDELQVDIKKSQEAKRKKGGVERDQTKGSKTAEDATKPRKSLESPLKSKKQTRPEKREPESVSEESSSEEDVPKVKVVPGGPDLARGEGLVSSSSEESEEEELADGDKFDHNWGELDQGASVVEDATSRLAVCNMDWDRIKAQDIMIIVHSFKPQGGLVKSVAIYPSEFGLARMKEEQIHGPKELVEDKVESDEEDPLEGPSEKTSGSQYHRERLRQYQLNRLKYYYAVIECDSRVTANAIYADCDGMEYESSSARLDLRFIPEDMTFDHEPKSVVKDVADIATYKPTLFFNTALNQSKVELTWDETDQDRLKVTMRKPKAGDIDVMDVQAYLASSSGEEEEEDVCADDTEGDRLNKYRALLQGLESKEKNKGEKNMEMQISWEPGLRDTTADLVKKKAEEKDMTPWEKYLYKKKEKNKMKREGKTGKKAEEHNPEKGKESDDESLSDDDLPAGIDLNDPYFKEEMEGDKPAKKVEGKKKKKKKGRKEETEEGKQEKAELQLLMMDEDDDHEHFNLKDIMKKEKLEKKKKRKKRKKMKDVSQVEDTFTIDVNDPRFDAMYKSHHYNVDPSSHEYKKTKAMESFINEKLKRKKVATERVGDSGAALEKKKIKLDPKQDSRTGHRSLLSLVKSVKMKTQQYQQKKELKKS